MTGSEPLRSRIGDQSIGHPTPNHWCRSKTTNQRTARSVYPNQRASESTGATLPGVDRHLAAGAFVCDALDRTERIEFEHHLLDCPSCREDVRSFTEAMPAFAIPGIEPAPHVRARVLASLEFVRQVSPIVPPRSHWG